MMASETPTTIAAISAAKVMRSVIEQRARERAPVVPERLRDQERPGQDVMRNALDADVISHAVSTRMPITTGAMIPGQELARTPRMRRSSANTGRASASVPSWESGVGERQLAHAAIASRKVPEATRQRCAYSAEVRNSASRGYGASLRRSAITRPGRAAITTMRCER